MRKYRSGSRKEYDRAYRQLRLQGGIFDIEHPFENYDDAEDCAILSYDYHDSDFSGWINRQRHQKFFNLKLDRHPELVFPF